MEITEKVTGPTLVRAGINEKKFFERMGHLFESSFSVLGELMQNARRAGATRIDFNIDAENKSLSIRDDGHGIADFAAVINLCDSVWSEGVVLEDMPFGMGLFSVFYTGESVDFLSKGKKLSMSIDDIVSKRMVAVVDDNAAPDVGTTVKINGLSDKFLKSNEVNDSAGKKTNALMAIERIKGLCRGFPVPVFVNGHEMERPHAEDKMTFVHSDIGLISIGGIHRHCGALTNVRHTPVTYLQGLPIGWRSREPNDFNPIVHLDSVRFIAKMPDRNELFDAPEQNNLITASLTATAKQFLIAQKASLSPSEMVLRHWDDCERLNLLYLFNDIPLVPINLFSRVESVRIWTDCDSVFEEGIVRAEPEFISRQDVINGRIIAWMKAPSSTDEDPWAAVCLKVMQANGIQALTGNIDEAHWLHKLLPSVSDMVFSVTASGASEQSEEFYASCSRCSATIRLCDAISIKVTSVTDSEFDKTYLLENNWMLVPVHQADGSFGDGYQAFVCRVDQSPDYPIRAMSTYIEDGYYNEDRFTTDLAEWGQLLNNLNGAHLATIVTNALSSHTVHFSAVHLSQMAVCSVGFGPRSARSELKVCAVDDGTFDALAIAIGGVTAVQLKQAFETVFAAGQPG